MSAPAVTPRLGTGLAVLLAGAALFVIAAGAAALLVGNREAGSNGISAPVDALYAIAVDSQGALAGETGALVSFQKDLRSLKDSAARDSNAAYVRDPRFTHLLDNAAIVLQSRDALTDASNAARDSRDLVTRLLGEIANVGNGLSSPSQESAIRALERFESRAQRVQLDVAALTSGAANPGQLAQRLGESTDYLGQVIQGLMGTSPSLGLPRLTGAEGEKRLKTLDSLYTDLNGAVHRAVAAAPTIPAALAAGEAVRTEARAIAAEATAAAAAPARSTPWLKWVPLALAAVALLFVLACLLHAWRLSRTMDQQRQAAETQRKENDRNQQAILRLLDELSSLADGDLTVQATVTEDITGAIADSINYAVDALRGLVTTINQSAIQLDSATRQTQALSGHLAKASGAQSKQIASATESAGGMATSAEEVSGNAERAADVARHSVEVAHKGGDAVRRTIDGMNTIRETIQETSKRIKRLGESSQEIGNIVELINDIAEQTNILALNASIQASMAGEAGRGFAVVADEVQRLAERAANATKQIEVLVRTIQTDTNEAVVSMERSTTDVVGGALLAENAGAALEEIEQVSNQIASLVQNISGSSRQQTGAAQNIARNMQILKEISAQTAESTHATSTAIAKLAELSAGLRRAAAGFRLPGAAAEPGGGTGTFKRPDDTKPTTSVRQGATHASHALGGT
ncbi:MAG TPA: methyl-accepting chemotaxis protein [Steroidobacteraceae bacterium]|nr:methyl-accepting chemotaxis protein [Steroidobacteraceae bacterium]